MTSATVRWLGMQLRRSSLVFTLSISVASARPETRIWPNVPPPEAAESFEAGEVLVVNGQPTRLYGFVSSQRPENVERWYRDRLGQPLMQDRIGDKRVLGRMLGDFYVTVQLESAGDGTRGLVGVCDLKPMRDLQEQTRTDTERWLGRLPAGSRIVDQISTEENGRWSRQWVITNGNSIGINRNRLISILEQEGLSLEYDSDDRHAARATGRTLVFRGKGSDATAVISRDTQGLTAVVLNMVAAAEQAR